MKNQKPFIIIASVLLVVLLSGAAYGMASYNKNIAIVKVADSTQLTQKIKTAVLGDGKVELSEPELNGILDIGLSTSSKLKDRLKNAYITIQGNDVVVNAVVSLYNHNFFISSIVSPGMSGGNIKLGIHRLTIGRITIPKSAYTYFASRYFSKGVKINNDGSIETGSKILMFDVQNIAVESGKVKLQFRTEIEETQPDSTETASQPEDQNSPTPTSTPTPKPTASQPKVDPRVTALKKTNSQLYGVLKDVKSSASKEWVNLVISVNSKMISNPDGDFTNDVNNAKSIYSKLPESDRKDIKEAAMNNLDMASVRFLYNEYGL